MENLGNSAQVNSPEVKLNQPQVVKAPEKKNNLAKIFIFLIIIFGFITTFIAGFYLHDILKSEQFSNSDKKNIKITQAPNVSKGEGSKQDEVQFPPEIPGKKFFEDTILLVAKSDPHITLIATSNRQETDSGYSQNTRVSFFDGTSWKRVSKSGKIPNSNVTPNGLIGSWTENIDPSRVLKEDLNGSIVVENENVSFSTNTLKNEISMRSLPGYTKFMSNGEGSITKNGKNYPAYVLRTRIYSMDSSQIQFYNQPFGVTTDWIVFWDGNGNFYHVDKTDVEKPTDIYKPHSIGVFEDSAGILSKTFDVNVNRDGATPPNNYQVALGSPVNKNITLNLLNSINKVPSGAFDWFMGQVSGTSEAGGSNGIGIVEYIHD